jgi:hypothetical protein
MDTDKPNEQRPKVAIHDAVTGVTQIRDMTDDEMAQYEKDQLEAGEQAAPQPVEEEEPSDAPVADSSSPPSDS